MKITNRRSFVRRSIGVATAAVAAGVSQSRAEGPNAPGVGNRFHIFASPKVKQDFIRCFSTVLGCGAPVSLNAPGLAEPILAFKFPGGGSVSVEFTEDALDEQKARRGAWIEIWSDDPGALKKRILDAGLPQVIYPATNTFYFGAPGGQVVGVVAARNPSSGELRLVKPQSSRAE